MISCCFFEAVDPILSSTVITWSNLSRDFTPAMREAGSEHTAYLSLGGGESYGVSVMRILQKIDRVMTVPLCIWHRT